MTALAEWTNYYLMIATSAGALIGLQFVVVTLVADKHIKSTETSASALLTPPIVHLGCALLVSILSVVPWPRIEAIIIMWGLVGLGGIVYVAIVSRLMRVQGQYQPVWEDWLFRAILPFVSYGLLGASAAAGLVDAHYALFGVAAATLLLLFLGIHNAWDTIVYLAIVKKE